MSLHILIIGWANETHKKFVEKGNRVSVIMPINKLVKVKQYNTYERLVAIPNYAGIEEWKAQAALINKLDNVDAIACFNENLEEITAEIAKALKLKYYNCEVIEKTHNKALMRKALNDANIDLTKGKHICQEEEILEFALENGFPIILKPIDGKGSTGISIINNRYEIQNAIRWLRGHDEKSRMYVETYLQGDEYSVESFSENGAHRIVCITKKYKDNEHFIELGHCLPAILAEQYINEIKKLVSETLSELGIMYGPTHTEIIITENGPRIVETHTRLGGDHIPELIKYVSGLDLMDLWVRQILGEKVMSKLPEYINTDCYAAIWYVSTDSDGVLESVSGLGEAKSVLGVMDAGIIQVVGSNIARTYNSSSRGAYVIAKAPTHEKALTISQEAALMLKFNII